MYMLRASRIERRRASEHEAADDEAAGAHRHRR